MSRTGSSGVWRLVVIVVATACSSRSDPPAPPPAPLAPPANAVEPPPPTTFEVRTFPATPAPKLPEQRSFEVTAPGDGARTALRYQLAAGATTTDVVARISSRQLVDGAWSARVTLPAIHTGFELARAAAPATTQLTALPLPGKITGEPTAEATQYLASWRALEGRPFTFALDDRGQLGAIEGAEASARDELTQRLLATLVPVPAAPIGLGGSWRVVTVLQLHPAVVKQTATYTLVGRAAHWTVDVTLDRVGEPQVLLDPSLPAGTTAELVALVQHLAGQLEIDPARALPTGKLTLESTVHVRLQRAGAPAAEQLVEDSGTIELAPRAPAR